MQALLLLALLVALIASESMNQPSLVFPMEEQLQANRSTPAGLLPTVPSAVLIPEAKKMEWQPSQPDFTQIHQQQQQQQQQQEQQQQQPGPMSYPTMPNLQPFIPTNYYLPANQYPAPPTTEFRSDHYAYPFEPNYPYPVSQPPMDSSLIPTGKHFIIVSFIGLLLLFAIVQNSIAAAKRKDALVEVLSNRRKRDIIASPDFETMSPEVESALKEDARVRCIQRTLCYENRKLLEDLGVFGKVLAKYLTRSVQSSLKELSPGWDRLVEDAANAGLRGEDCNVVYRDCNFEISDDSETIDHEEGE